VLRTLCAAVCGLLLAFAFPPHGIWPLSVLAVAGLSLLTYGRSWKRGLWIGFVFGLVFDLVLLYWLNDSIGTDAWLVLSPVEALYFGLMGAGLALVARLRWWPLWTACLWVAQEAARGRWPLGGFPWGRLAFTNAEAPFAPLASLGGEPLVTFAVALCGALVAAAVPAVRRARIGWAAVTIVGAAAVAAAGQAVPLATAGQSGPKGPATARIAIIQGNVPHAGMDFLGRPMQVLQNHVSGTEKLATQVQLGTAPKPDLVVWPENASDADPYSDPAVHVAIDAAAKSIDAPILVGALVDGSDGRLYNESVVWDPATGPGAAYAKRHLVPFGEYVPFRSLLSSWITELRRIGHDFTPGTASPVLRAGGVTVGEAMCFEVAYDGSVHQAVADGGRVLVIPTNNATYERTDQPGQQWTIARMRAIETGRSVVVSATSGISGVIRPDGSVQSQTALATAAQLDESVALRDSPTLADRVGAVPEWVLTGLGVLAAGWAGARALRRRRAAGAARSAGRASAEPGAPAPR